MTEVQIQWPYITYSRNRLKQYLKAIPDVGFKILRQWFNDLDPSGIMRKRLELSEAITAVYHFLYRKSISRCQDMPPKNASSLEQSGTKKQ